jgi:hypothetical protein
MKLMPGVGLWRSVAHLFEVTSGSGEHDAAAKPKISAIAAFRIQAFHPFNAKSDGPHFLIRAHP